MKNNFSKKNEMKCKQGDNEKLKKESKELLHWKVSICFKD